MFKHKMFGYEGKLSKLCCKKGSAAILCNKIVIKTQASIFRISSK